MVGPPQSTPEAYERPPDWGTPMPPQMATAPTPVVSNRGLATALMILIPVTALGGIASALASPELDLVNRGEAGYSADQGLDAFGIIGSLAGLGALIVGLIWVFRTARNAQVLGGDGKPSPGWALGCWFIPVGNLFLPYFPLRQAWDRSKIQGAGPLLAWAILWPLGLGLTVVAAFRILIWGMGQARDMPEGTMSVEIPADMAAFQIVAQVAYAAAGALFLVVVRKFDQAQAVHAAPPSQTGPA